MSESDRLPTIYLPHGGGPWNAMMDEYGPDSGYEALAAYLRELGVRFKSRAKSILVVSAHWEGRGPPSTMGRVRACSTITAAFRPIRIS
jgi:aromatic ring-opening dioxygenase catalytic subunit (LigB family)